MIVKTLSECINSEDLFDTIVLRNSYGKDYILFHYNSLGLGNLLITYAGACSINQVCGNKKILSFPKNRIQGRLVFFRSPLRWFARSEFGFDKINDLYNRYILIKRINEDFSDTTISFIDSETRVLYLSSHMVNEDDKYIQIIRKNIDYLKNDDTFFRYFGVDFIKRAKTTHGNNTGLSIGVHLRRGDFLVSSTTKIEENSSPPIESVIQIIDIFKKYKISTVTIYSDQSRKITNNLINKHFPKFFKYKVFNPMAKGASVLNDMISKDIMIQSNSTLSTWSGMISGQISPFIGNDSPWQVSYEFNNFVRSDGIFARDLVALINSEIDLKI